MNHDGHGNKIHFFRRIDRTDIFIDDFFLDVVWCKRGKKREVPKGVAADNGLTPAPCPISLIYGKKEFFSMVW